MKVDKRAKNFLRRNTNTKIIGINGLLVFILLFFLSLTVFMCSSRTKNQLAQVKEFARELDDLREKLNIPGLAACVIKDRKVIFQSGFGASDVKQNIKTTENTVFQLASVTKVFGATIVMQMVEEEIIDLDDPVSKYNIDMDHSDEIKVKHLLSHTSDYPPGNQYRYDGNRYALLDKIVLKATGKSVEEVLINRIISPLQFQNTVPGNNPDRYDDVYTKLARPYDYNETNEIVDGQYNPYFGCAAGLISSVTELAKFDIALDSYELISKDSLQQCFTPMISTKGDILPYGLGWFSQAYKGIKLIWAFGYGYSTSSLYLKVPEENLTLIVLANSNNLSRPFPIGLINATILDSPIAMAFLKEFVFHKLFEEKIPQFDWFCSSDNSEKELNKIQNIEIKDLIKTELQSFWNIARCTGEKETQHHLLLLYKNSFAKTDRDTFNNHPILAKIANIDKKGSFSESFTIDKKTNVRLYAIADGSPWGEMYDQAWLETNGKVIWKMYGPDTKDAGGHLRNRVYDAQLSLDAGEYKVFFNNSKSPYDHYYGNWEAFPPDHLFWGIVIQKINE